MRINLYKWHYSLCFLNYLKGIFPGLKGSLVTMITMKMSPN